MSSWKQHALIEAPVAEVWGVLCDPVRGPEWSEDVIAVTGAPTKIEKGSTFDVTSRGPLRMKGTTTFAVEELEDMHELKMKCQVSGYYSRWLLTQAQDGTFTEVELGIEPLESKSVQGRPPHFIRRAIYGARSRSSSTGCGARSPAIARALHRIVP